MLSFSAFFFSFLNQIPEALGYVRQALQLQGDDANSLHLLALLLSAQKHYHDALNIIDMALSEYPENFMWVNVMFPFYVFSHIYFSWILISFISREDGFENGSIFFFPAVFFPAHLLQVCLLKAC